MNLFIDLNVNNLSHSTVTPFHSSIPHQWPPCLHSSYRTNGAAWVYRAGNSRGGPESRDSTRSEHIRMKNVQLIFAGEPNCTVTTFKTCSLKAILISTKTNEWTFGKKEK